MERASPESVFSERGSPQTPFQHLLGESQRLREEITSPNHPDLIVFEEPFYYTLRDALCGSGIPAERGWR